MVKLESAVSFNAENLKLTIDSDDFEMKNELAEVRIKIVQDFYKDAEDFVFKITFKAEPPAFKMEGYSVEPLTCSEKDRIWSMELPPMTTED